MNANHIKCALLHYYRFKRQYVCVDECISGFGEIADILVDTEKTFLEIEVKLSKSDLNQEKHKKKHSVFKEEHKFYKKESGTNYFYICVPIKLKEHAEKWINKINPKYGLILYCSNPKTGIYKPLWQDCISIIKKASKLHKGYNKNLKKKIAKRLSSSLANAYSWKYTTDNKGRIK